MITQILLMAFMAFIITETEGNHPGAHHHDHQHHQTNHQIVQTPFVSSFSHSLPGTNSYMSVTRYFNAPAAAALHTAPTLNHSDSVDADSDDPKYYDPWNPRFQVSFYSLFSSNDRKILE